MRRCTPLYSSAELEINPIDMETGQRSAKVDRKKAREYKSKKKNNHYELEVKLFIYNGT